ncbi:hypothetical protein D3C80_1981340 [compost metagenome]
MRTLAPGALGAVEAVAAGEIFRADEDASLQRAAGDQGLAAGFAVLQRAGLLLAQAQRLGQPECMKIGTGFGNGGGSHTRSRRQSQRRA